MSPLLFAALVAILAHQPNLRISRISEPVRTVISQSAHSTTTVLTHEWTSWAMANPEQAIKIMEALR